MPPFSFYIRKYIHPGYSTSPTVLKLGSMKWWPPDLFSCNEQNWQIYAHNEDIIIFWFNRIRLKKWTLTFAQNFSIQKMFYINHPNELSQQSHERADSDSLVFVHLAYSPLLFHVVLVGFLKFVLSYNSKS